MRHPNPLNYSDGHPLLAANTIITMDGSRVVAVVYGARPLSTFDPALAVVHDGVETALGCPSVIKRHGVQAAHDHC